MERSCWSLCQWSWFSHESRIENLARGYKVHTGIMWIWHAHFATNRCWCMCYFLKEYKIQTTCMQLRIWQKMFSRLWWNRCAISKAKEASSSHSSSAGLISNRVARQLQELWGWPNTHACPSYMALHKNSAEKHMKSSKHNRWVEWANLLWRGADKWWHRGWKVNCAMPAHDDHDEL